MQEIISLFWIAKDASTTTSTFYDIEKGWFSMKPLMFFLNNKTQKEWVPSQWIILPEPVYNKVFNIEV